MPLEFQFLCASKGHGSDSVIESLFCVQEQNTSRIFQECFC